MKLRWKVKKLGEVGAAIREQAKIVAEREYELWSVPSFDDGVPEFPFGKDIGSAKLRVRPDDVLICKINPRINRVWLVSKPLNGREQIASTEWLVFRANLDAELSPGWLIHFVSAPKFREWIASEVSGATGSHTRARADGILQQEIPVPPLPEQQRIVAILDEAFEGIATAKANAEKNLQNASDLFESHLEAVFSLGGPGWGEKALGDVCELFQGLCVNAKTKHLLVEKSALPLLRIKDLRSNTAEQYVAGSGWPKNAQVSESDIIYTRTGQIGLVFRGRVGILHNNCFKVRPKSVLNSEYLFWWLQNPAFRGRITTLASKAAQPDITHSLFKVQPILVPPRDYQNKVIPLIDGMREETQRLESIYQQKLAALEELKRSLLHHAFTGQL